MSGKEILFGEKLFDRLLAGAEYVSNIVTMTMGPKGKNVIIDKSHGEPTFTKDGVTVVKSISFPEDRGMEIAAQALKAAATKSNDLAGDGTTTTTLLTYTMFKKARKIIAAGASARAVSRGMKYALEAALAILPTLSRKVTTVMEMEQVASISAGDSEIGKHVAYAMDKIGKDGVLTVEESNKSQNFELTISPGMSFERGYISHYFGNPDKCELEKPLIFISDFKISSMQHILHFLEHAAQSGRPLLIIAEDVEGEALAALVVNKLRGGLKLAAVKAPGFGERKKDGLEDIAILTGGTYYSEDRGYTLESIKSDGAAGLGTAHKVIITKDETVIVGGAGSDENVAQRRAHLERLIENSGSDYDKEKAQERLAKLSGGVGILKVGGLTEIEAKETKFRVEDSYRATTAAVAEGITPGGGCAYLYIASMLFEELEKRYKLTPDELMGAKIFMDSLSAPTEHIVVRNGGYNHTVLEKLSESKDRQLVFDAENGKFVNAFEAGIIDPAKVVRIALLSSVSVARNLIMSGGGILIKPEQNNKKQHEDMPDMY